jgi:hypothetical protein
MQKVSAGKFHLIPIDDGKHATREPHIASTSGSVDRARKSGDWLRMQCLPMARGLPFKQDAVSACPRVAAAFDKIHRSV